METKPIVSYCGLYCSNCRKFKKGNCPGCHKNEKASWCNIRTCIIEKEIESCADCKEPGIEDCKIFNNPVSRLFAFVFNSDRAASIQLIKDEGYSGFINYMEESGKMVIPRRRKY